MRDEVAMYRIEIVEGGSCVRVYSFIVYTIICSPELAVKVPGTVWVVSVSCDVCTVTAGS